MVFDTIAQIGFKLAANVTSPAALNFGWIIRVLSEQWIYMSVFGYAGAFVTWMTLLKHAPIGPAFAASHLEIVSVLLISVLFLGESLNVAQVVGSLLILGGIFVLAVEEDDEAKKSGEQHDNSDQSASSKAI